MIIKRPNIENEINKAKIDLFEEIREKLKLEHKGVLPSHILGAIAFKFCYEDCTEVDIEYESKCGKWRIKNA